MAVSCFHFPRRQDRLHSSGIQFNRIVAAADVIVAY